MTARRAERAKCRPVESASAPSLTTRNQKQPDGRVKWAGGAFGRVTYQTRRPLSIRPSSARRRSWVWASVARRGGACTHAIWRWDALATRRPLLSLRFSGWLPLRLPERAFDASSLYPRPRLTRLRERMTHLLGHSVSERGQPRNVSSLSGAAHVKTLRAGDRAEHFARRIKATLVQSRSIPGRTGVRSVGSSTLITGWGRLLITSKALRNRHALDACSHQIAAPLRLRAIVLAVGEGVVVEPGTVPGAIVLTARGMRRGRAWHSTPPAAHGGRASAWVLRVITRSSW